MNQKKTNCQKQGGRHKAMMQFIGCEFYLTYLLLKLTLLHQTQCCQCKMSSQDSLQQEQLRLQQHRLPIKLLLHLDLDPVQLNVKQRSRQRVTVRIPCPTAYLKIIIFNKSIIKTVDRYLCRTWSTRNKRIRVILMTQNISLTETFRSC